MGETHTQTALRPNNQPERLQPAHGSGTLGTCKDNAPQCGTRHVSINLTFTISRSRRRYTTGGQELGQTAKPPSRPPLLFHALFSLRRASSIRSRAPPTAQNHYPLGITNQKTPTHTQRNQRPNQKTGATNRRRKVEETFTPRRTEPTKAELQKPPLPETRAGGDGAEGASISRRRNIHWLKTLSFSPPYLHPTAS
ncbi:unnamed protein product [Brassica napus]|uniref:(rape) hypothetical protein n=1 Tax=Brassica napus TaxID=3708 RepID=A0A816Z174_BRANA|nr:unnamed protein product [Brassica napus]